jgi:geranylgeranyl diphosphate synthase type II
MPRATPQEQLHRYLVECRRLIDDALDRFVPPLGTTPVSLHEAMRYSLLAPAERLRGALVLSCAELFRGGGDQAVALACVVEMVHAGSGILDDLPSMDDAGLRGGRPVLHDALGEANAILAAVALVNAGFELIQDVEGLRDRTRRELTKRLARAVGAGGLIGGRVIDSESSTTAVDPEALRTLDRRKTAALFVVAAELGGVVAGARARDLAALQDYAEPLGLAYQLTDDLLAYSGDPHSRGKRSAPERATPSFVERYGIDGARRLVDEQIDTALAALRPFKRQAGSLAGLAELVRCRDR